MSLANIVTGVIVDGVVQDRDFIDGDLVILSHPDHNIVVAGHVVNADLYDIKGLIELTPEHSHKSIVRIGEPFYSYPPKYDTYSFSGEVHTLMHSHRDRPQDKFYLENFVGWELLNEEREKVPIDEIDLVGKGDLIRLSDGEGTRVIAGHVGEPVGFERSGNRLMLTPEHPFSGLHVWNYSPYPLGRLGQRSDPISTPITFDLNHFDHYEILVPYMPNR